MLCNNFFVLHIPQLFHVSPYRLKYILPMHPTKLGDKPAISSFISHFSRSSLIAYPSMHVSICMHMHSHKPPATTQHSHRVAAAVQTFLTSWCSPPPPAASPARLPPRNPKACPPLPSKLPRPPSRTWRPPTSPKLLLQQSRSWAMGLRWSVFLEAGQCLPMFHEQC